MRDVRKHAPPSGAEQAELSSEVWLLSGLISSLPGLLELADGQLAFTAVGTGTCWPFQLRALERGAERCDFADKLDNGEPSELFRVPLAEISDVVFPWYYVGCGMKLTIRGTRYRFSFVQPQNTKVPKGRPDNFIEAIPELLETAGTVTDGRNLGRMWQSVLAANVERPAVMQAS